jgi:photosystem II stability/assembly factor-like uncharacterized protein
MTRESYARQVAFLMIVALLGACTSPRATEQVSAPSVVAPSPTTVALIKTHTPVTRPTREPSPFPSATASVEPSATHAPLPSATARSSPSSTLVPRTSVPPAGTPSPPPVAGVVIVTGPLQIDGGRERIYTPCQVDGRNRTCVLGTMDGALLATWEISGSLALDSSRGWLYVDGGSAGLAVVDANSGQALRSITLPPSSQSSQSFYPAPQADPAAGQVLAFRENVVYVIDAEQGEVTRQISFDVPIGDRCRQMDGPLGISWSAYDSTRRLLYLDFVTYWCTPWIGHSVVSYDMSAGVEVARSGVTSRGPGDVVAWQGYLYGVGWYRMGVGYRWAWRDGQPWLSSSYWTYPEGGLAVDPGRGLLYQGAAQRLHVFDLQNTALMFVTALSAGGHVAGYDQRTDNLYLLDEGRVTLWPAARVQRPTAQALQASTIPTTTLRSLLFSPTWTEDHTLFGTWDETTLLPPCWVFGVQGGPLLMSLDGGDSWRKPVGGLMPDCSGVQIVAASPDYARDKTLLASIVGLGLHRSTDGGRLWEPSGVGLGSLAARHIIISPAYAQDRMAYLIAGEQDTLYRSTDGGRTWQSLGERCGSVAISPEFEEDRTLLGTWYSYSNNQKQMEVRVSRDSGASWESVGTGPVSEFSLLSLAPLFAQWRVAFGYGDGALYRSSDGGSTWQVVLSQPGLVPVQMTYAPDMETDRPAFLVALEASSSEPTGQGGRLYTSADGGQTWKAIDLENDVQPRALAISPSFAQDSTLFVGTADARVIILQGSELR